MGILFLSAFFGVSLGLFILIASFGNHLFTTNVLRLALSLIVLPAIICSLLFFKIIFINQSITYSRVLFPFITIDFGIYLNNSSCFIIICSTLALVATIFILPKKYFSLNIALFSAICVVLLLPQVFANLLVGYCFYIIASIFVFYFGIIDNDKKFLTAIPAADFLWQRASDILALISLLLIFIDLKTLHVFELAYNAHNVQPFYAALFFGAMIMRIINLPTGNSFVLLTQDNGFNAYLLGRLYISLGALLFLLRSQQIIFSHQELKNIYMTTAGLLLCHAIFYCTKRRKLIYLPTNINYLACAVVVGLFSLDKFYLSEIIIYTLIIFMPVFAALRSTSKYYLKKPLESRRLNDDPVVIIGTLARTLTNFGASFATSFIGLFYANFLLYRLPQIILSFIQLPLRIFHTGSLQRSMLFIAILVTSYYWLWS